MKELFFLQLQWPMRMGYWPLAAILSTERLLLAYKNGIFPWYNEDEPICWWCPDPRFVLFPKELKISKSMHTVLNNGSFQFTINKAFDKVIALCKSAVRKGQDGTWIQPEVITAYTKLHQQGFAVSAEAWQGDELVGGLYGVLLDKIFFGESMFSKKSNASKFAFIKFVQYLQKNIQLIDCQVYTPHLESLGARMIPRKDFSGILSANIH
ncbi:leucyl/phenylalanyl-tRNA--protein transferase [Ferruginibacter sp.]